MDVAIPISAVDIGCEEERLVVQTLRSGQLAQGPMVERLEREFVALTGARHAVAVSSGTAALTVALEALGLGPGDEVITSPFTFVATLNAILETGATATFIDIADDFTIDPTLLERAITPSTKAVLPVHLYGQPAAMDEIVPLVEAHGLALVEDAAQAHGASVGGRAVGSFGVGCFSLYATKNVAAGEGGVVTCDDDAVARRGRLLRNQGMSARYEYELPGHNLRLTDLQAAVAIPQLARLSELTARRRENAAALSAGLSGLDGLELPTVAPGREHVWHQYTVRVGQDAARSRDEVAALLAAKGIATGVYYPRVVFDYACYRDHPRVRATAVPAASRAASEVLSLPVHPGVSESDIERIVGAVREALTC